MEYRANLNGIKIHDELKCDNGDEIRHISTIVAGIKAMGYALNENKHYVPVDIKHDEINPNCWKVYK